MMGKVFQGWNLVAIAAVMGGQVLVAEVVWGKMLVTSQPSWDQIGKGRDFREQAIVQGEEPIPYSLFPTLQYASSTHAQNVAPIQITDIQLNATEAGLEIILIAESGALPSPQTEVVGNAVVAEIPNAVLTLPEGDELQVFDPAEGIAVVQAVTTAEGAVQLSITGTETAPLADVSVEGQTLRLGVVLGDSTLATGDDETLRVVVTGEEESPYVVPNATTATRTDTPLRDIPQSIQVIPKEVLEDQQIVRLNDALRNVSGVVANENDPRGQRFIVRGFDSASVLRDGFRLTFGSTGNVGFQDLSHIQQIEVLKGPASILSGAIEPGGVINLVSEQPTSEPFYEFGLRVGNRGFVEPSLDISGPLTEDGRVLYRLNALYRRENSFRDFNSEVDRIFIAPVVDWQINDRTDLTLNLEYYEEDRPSDFGLVAVGDEVADIPLDQPLGELDDTTQVDSLRVGYRFEHRFSDQWKVRNAFYYTRFDTEVVSAFPFGGGLDETTGILPRTFILLDQPSDTFEFQTNVVGEFSTGPVDHKVLVGVDLFRREAFDNTIPADLFNPVPINIFDPVFGALEPDFGPLPLVSDLDIRTDALGVYFQDQVTLLDNLKLLAGFRYETVEQETTSAPSLFGPGGTTTQNDDAFSPRVGLVYQPIEAVSLFGSFSRSFTPNGSTTIADEPLEPERGEQFEVGAKAELLGDRLAVSVAYFDITLENVASPDPDFPLLGSVAIGEERSRGVELDVIGEILPGWSVVANYAFTDAEITEDNGGLEGNRRFGVPRHNFNLFTNYEIQQGKLEGLGFGVGFNFISDRFGDNANSFELDSYFLTNAAISYRRDNWKVGLNFRNLFDVDYIESAANSRTSEINPGEDFTVIGSFSITF